MKKWVYLGFLFIAALQSTAQEKILTTAIRGTVIDKQSQYPLPGAIVTVQTTSPVLGAAADGNGNFYITNVPIGRQSVQVTYMGYEPQVFSNLLLNSGKELELNVQLVESIVEMNTVEITAKENKAESLNKMSTVSTRSFSVEEAMRYSGTLQDPSRMAQNYAGVSNASDDRNDIIIRGNSPTGVLWRLEGIDIPSPNHFSTLGTTGGPISMLNVNNLANSDFATSAFAAEYGNALAGVFDLRLRSGNQNKREYTGQIGFNGVELGLEGPFSKGHSATYMANYRYSFLDALNAVGVNFGTGDAIPQYQDLTFKVDLPTATAGRWSVFGMGGKSFIDFKPEEALEDNLYATDKQHQQFESTTGVLGLSHSYFFNDKTQGKLVIAATTSRNSGWIDTLDTDKNEHRWFGVNNVQDKYSAHYSVNTKLNSRHTLKIGAMADYFDFLVQDSLRVIGDYFFLRRNEADQATLVQGYAMWQFRPSEDWTINSGVHAQYFAMNQTSAVEPRLGAKYRLNQQQSLSAGLGLHSQMQPIVIYYNREELSDGSVLANNRNLGFNRAAHAVLGYDNQFTQFFRLRTEVYYQYLFDQAVDRTPDSFSIINAGADFILPDNGDLVNKGIGNNYGLEITLEHFLNKGFYFLTTVSLFESTYEGSDGVERNTTFNGNYVFNVLAGKEWKAGKNNAITLDFKTTLAGGRRYTPIDLEASRLAGDEVRIMGQANSLQYDPYFRTDVKIGFRMNREKYSQAFSFDVRNVTNNQNVFLMNYDNTTGNIETIYQTGFFPMVLWNIYF